MPFLLNKYYISKMKPETNEFEKLSLKELEEVLSKLPPLLDEEKFSDTDSPPLPEVAESKKKYSPLKEIKQKSENQLSDNSPNTSTQVRKVHSHNSFLSAYNKGKSY